MIARRSPINDECIRKMGMLLLFVLSQIRLAIAALSPGVVLLIKDLNGNHVVQRCLQVGKVKMKSKTTC